MKIERTKNATRNIFHGVLLKAYTIIMPFIMRTVIIYVLGREYLGLNGLFTSILQVLNLAELGVGSAMVFSMYKPIVEDDTDKICALMRLYRTYYRIIACVVLTAGLAILPFLPYLVKADTVPQDINLYVLYILNLASTVASYCLFAYKNSLLAAYQRVDVESKVSIAVSSISYLAQIVLLFVLKNYYVYSVILVLTSLANNIVTAVVVSRMFPGYHPKGTLSKEETKAINKRVKDLFTARLGGTITLSSDALVISAFLGLTVLSIYQNYYFIVTAVIGFIMVVFNSTIAGIGNSLVVESGDKNYLDFRKFTFLINWIAIVCISCFLCLFQPFIRLWVGEENMLEYPLVILFCVFFYLFVIQQLACVYKDAAGIWHQDRWRPLIMGLFNLGLNLAFVRQFGLYAILLSTIASYVFVGIPWLIRNLFRTIFHRNAKEHILFIITGFILAFGIGAVSYYLCSVININPIADLALRLLVSVLVSNVLLFAIYRKHHLYNHMLDLADNVLHHKMHKLICKLKTK